jgi:hypothetical protein
MAKFLLIALLFLPTAVFGDIRSAHGKWLVTDYRELPIHALTREEAREKYGRGLIIYSDWIAFGGESIKSPVYRTVRIRNEEEFESKVGTSSKTFGGSAETLQVIEVLRSDSSPWMHPGGLLILKSGEVFTVWDCLIFVFKKS